MADVTRTVGDLLGDLRDRADIELMEVRHKTVRLLQYLTVSLREAQNMAIKEGLTEVLTWGTVGTLPAAPPASQSYLEVTFPAGIEIHGVDVHNGVKFKPLTRINIADRREYEAESGPPRAYLIQSLPRTPVATADPADMPITPGVIQIYPANTEQRSYQLIYLEPHPPLTKLSQPVYGFNGDLLEWAIWNAAIKVLFKDDEMDPSQDAKAVRERAKIEARIAKAVTTINRAGPIVPRRAGRGRRARREV